MSFKRNECQEYIEQAQKCFDRTQWTSYKNKFEKWVISDSVELNRCAQSDALSYFIKALMSFSLAIDDLMNKKCSWAIVKFYYSLFYLLRADILLSGHIIVRCNSLYYTKNEPKASFQKLTAGKERGDHGLSIALYKRFHNNGIILDPLLDNNLDGNDVYTWYRKCRERINYSQKDFSEPDISDMLIHVFRNYIDDGGIEELFSFYDSNSYAICFDQDHALLSVPYKKLNQVYNKVLALPHNIDSLRKIIFCINILEKCGIKKSFILKNHNS